MKRRIPKRSAKGKRLDVADKLMSQIIRIKRGGKCQICGRPGHCVFHIAEKGSYQRIRYSEWNLLWTCWKPCHHSHHHYGRNHPRTEYIHRRLQQLRGENYWQELVALNKTSPPMKPFQLELVIVALRQELKQLKGR